MSSAILSLNKLLPPPPCSSPLEAPIILIFILLFIYLFIYFWLCWVFVSVRGLSLVVASGRHSSSRCAGLSLSRPLLLRSTGSRRAGSVIVAHGPVAPRHVGSSQTRARTCVPCIGRWVLNHCATREAPNFLIYIFLSCILGGFLCSIFHFINSLFGCVQCTFNSSFEFFP